MTVLTDVDVLGDVARRPVPPQVARAATGWWVLRAQAMDLVREQGLQTRASWRIVPLDGEPGENRLAVHGRATPAGALAGASSAVSRPWLCAVATIGDALEQQVGELFAQRRTLGVALDSLGNELLFALSRRVQDRHRAEARKQGLTVAGELRAGDPGPLQLQAQHTVLQLAGRPTSAWPRPAPLMMNPASPPPSCRAWARRCRCRPGRAVTTMPLARALHLVKNAA